MNVRYFRWMLGLLQACLTVQVLKRLLRTVGGIHVQRATFTSQAKLPRLSVIVPVLNEVERLSPCLEGLLQQGDDVAEILVVDGGSCDGTQQLVNTFSRRDSRLRLVDASPIPPTWNGKSWGLHNGLQQVASSSEWVLMLDADVYPDPLLARSLLMHAWQTGLEAFSVATLQEITEIPQGFLHPALLTTLIYRFGMPGQATRKLQEVQANGQCFLVKREVLEACGGFVCTRRSVCEDVTLARTLVHAGYPVGFYEAGDLVHVTMYRSWREAWENWPRSLPMHDQFSGWQTWVGWLEIALVQALPLPLFLLLLCQRKRSRDMLFWLNGLGTALRLGVLWGTARAYRQRPWSYWLSPLSDLPVVLKLGKSALQRHHTWRGRTLIRGGAR
jgi:dolichol-phosphate mannosyltransferase